MFGLKIIEFPQDPYLSRNGQAHESPLSLKMGLPGNPRMAEEIVLQRAITLSQHLEVPIHISSISSFGSVRLVKEAKELGVKISADVSAHHLLLTEEAISEYKTQAKTTPPLREEVDRSALIKGLKDGTIDACTSSHEPFSEHMKQIEFDLAPPGVIGLETALLALIEAEGEIADLVVINPSGNWTYDPSLGLSRSQNSPFGGYKFKNQTILTASGGNIAWNSAEDSL